MRCRITFFALSLAVLTLPACNSAKPTGGPRAKVAFVSNNAFDFWTYAQAGCSTAAAENGVECVFKKPDPGDAAVQKQIIDDLVNQGVKAIAISVIDPTNQTGDLDAVAAKVPLLTVDNDAPHSKRLCYIGTNNYAAGREVGKLVREAMPEGGTVCIFVGQLEALNARQRREGMLDELADKKPPADINNPNRSKDGETYGKYKLHQTYTDQTVPNKAEDNASDALIALAGEKNLCLVGLWAYNPPAILNAAKKQNKLGQVKIVGFDENDETLKGVSEGHIFATVVQDPYHFGTEAVTQMAKLAKGEKYTDDPIHYVPHRVVTKTGGSGRVSVEVFQKELFGYKRSAR
ncbi:MAG TPA: sugar-binding protein [Gemmataceae bacterium]|jgi:ribose transport system substrate-binding protein|nr:sugar-binding protein [Gemmataceae bacterium]